MMDAFSLFDRQSLKREEKLTENSLSIAFLLLLG